MLYRCLSLVLSVGLVSSTALALAAAPLDQSDWIWSSNHAAGKAPAGTVYFRAGFEAPAGAAGTVRITCDNGYTVTLNGTAVGAGSRWEQVQQYDISKQLKPGRNCLAVEAKNDEPGAAGLVAEVRLKVDGKEVLALSSDKSWKVSDKPADNWQQVGFDDSSWATAQSLGRFGKTAPWGNRSQLAKPASALSQQATSPAQISVPKDFQLELLYTVPAAQQGSWVSLTVDPKGRLIASDQYGKLYRITPAPVGAAADQTQVEPLNVPIGEAQGLLCAFDSLYVVVNGKAAEGAGLYRLQDTNGDDQYDQVKLLRKLPGGGEHGPHAVLLSPDGKSLYVCAGNHTGIPAPETSRLPRNWSEDHLLGRMWDAGGHAVGIMAPGGWICRTDPEGKAFELIAAGFRNEYDIAFNTEGELFTYDADMEWDIGTAWYRPTRVNHATSGAEFGWRSGTGKWPAYYEDSLGSVVDIGPGSPTGVAFGTGAKFPAKYQKALFIADWSYGVLYAVHLEPNGASYTGTAERFAAGAPFQVTDLVVHPQDGALYFALGGRRTQSGLYRMTYTGSESTAPVVPTEDAGSAARAERRKLEAFHTGANPAAIDAAWPHLSSPDRALRYAARIALEHQPVAQWQARALAETNPQALITSMVALARNGDKSLGPQVIEALNRVEFAPLDEFQKLALLRAYGLALIRLDVPDAQQRAAVAARLSPHYPAKSEALNRELCQVLVYLEAPDVVAKTLALQAQAPTQEEQMHYALCLRNLKTGWTLEQRKAYFEWFLAAAAIRGGRSMDGFLRNIRQEAIAALPPADKTALAATLAKQPTPADPVAQGPPREFVKQWTVDDLIAAADSAQSGRNFARGREMFAAASCFKCHRFQAQGGIVGPDLTGVGRRFNTRNMLESIIEPSKEVSDQYQATIFLTTNGQQFVGRIANANGDNLMVMTDMLNPGNFTNLRTGDIEEILPSPASMMPTGLIDTLSQEEILDLLAYLRSGGNEADPVFQQK